MVQLFAAALLIVFSFLAISIIGAAAKKPYSNFDLWSVGIFLCLMLLGFGRLTWLAFGAAHG